ncbi:MAG: hypothetical protein KQH63_07605 [Desulfobulbaceae bacterium]|nr:hypothetical protein [Desulfobulbaceae bacterium]
MKMQKDMEAAMLKAHRSFVTELKKAVQVVEDELKQAAEMSSICTDEWCRSTEAYLDDLHKSVYSISEPRFSLNEDHEQIKHLRQQVRDLYRTFKNRNAT